MDENTPLSNRPPDPFVAARIDDPTPMQIAEELSGNICRCTGYGRIVAAVQQVAVDRSAANDDH